eukprot:jgi/Tetstr1/465043/TSEL_009771.t1
MRGPSPATKTGVAVFPCASGIGQEIFYALGGHKDVALYGINSGTENAGSCLYGDDGYVGGAPPMARDGGEALIGFLNECFARLDIGYVFPAYDDATVWLKRNQPRLRAVVVAPRLRTIETCRSKSATYLALAGVVRTPAVFAKGELAPSSLPVFVKPDAGEGSKRCRLVTDMRGVAGMEDDEIAVEYFPGPEYTVDCFTDAAGRTVAFPRVRHGVRAGLSVHTRPAAERWLVVECERMAARIAEVLPMKGAWFFQCKETADGGGAGGAAVGLLEVAPRIPGAMALTRHAGVNFPLCSLYCFQGREVTIAPCASTPDDVVKVYRNHAVFDHAFDAVFCDLDDTLIKDGRVCVETVAFLYRWKPTKRTVLITRHRGDVGAALRAHAVSESLFDEIVHMTDPADRKSRYVTPGSVLIDDSFRERREVSTRLGDSVLCLDVDCLSSEIHFRAGNTRRRHP